MTAEESSIPQSFTHSVKISDTAKGVRIDVYVYTNSLDTAVTESVKLYQEVQKKCQSEKIPIAPIEVKA